MIMNTKRQPLLPPKPLYWESFNLAGDALLKNFIQQIVIEGTPENSDLEGCTGVLLNHGKNAGIENIRLKINGFFRQGQREYWI